MLDPETIQRLAAELHASEKSRVQVEHFSRRFPGMTIEDGYAVSRAWVASVISQSMASWPLQPPSETASAREGRTNENR